MADYLDLYDYRRRVSALYRERARAFAAGEDPAPILQSFRQGKDELFAHHPQSALDEEGRSHFQGLRYFPYNPALRVPATLTLLEQTSEQDIILGERETLTMTTIGHLHFVLAETQLTLALYWLTLYGGGLFLPFRDTTGPRESYGGGRYLFDTIKGSEPFFPTGEFERQQMVLDFNYAYNPSCAYDYRWVCPLAPGENHLSVALNAGERNYQSADL
ncbi:MAG TPA: DUF1684 domain-containing protein [Ktedonobacteraceae bacterium]